MDKVAELLARVEELNEAATAGPWMVTNGRDVYRYDGDLTGRGHIADFAPDGWDSDLTDITPEATLRNSEYAVAARVLLPRLAEMVKVMLEHYEPQPCRLLVELNGMADAALEEIDDANTPQ